uniref:Uncharacterized protein LOC104212570 n=1 Tax=Nicotiana sylvestris TaxID=4096 RepID=A0A1U7V1B1_NICSY
MLWFKDGDRNTKFFHAQVNGRRKRLKLSRIQNSLGNWIEEDHLIAEEAVKFYKDQFTKSAVPNAFDILNHVPSMVDSDQHERLMALPSNEEVKRAVMGLNGDSAGGPDDFTGAFYQTCWETIEEDVVGMVRAFFCGQQLPKSVTHTNLVLLPKKKEVMTFADMRPIGLSNFVNKIFSRVIHERLIEFLPNLISQEQTGFVRGRSIVENAIMAIPDQNAKEDPEAFIGLIFDLIGNNWYSILINGQPNGFFKSSRGVKQGDPLSPTLFILAAEAMSRGLNSLHTNLYFCGFGMPKWSPKINHISYADATIIFSSSDETSLRLVMEVLQAYESSSGQLVNKAKYAIYLHQLTDNEVINKVERITVVERQTPICRRQSCIDRKCHAETKPSLWSAFISQKYCKKLNPVIVPWKRGSNVWRKMLECRDLIEHQIYWKPRMGSAQFWFDNWTELGALYFEVPAEFGIDEDIHNVNDLVENGMWNLEKLFQTLPEDLANHIVQNIRPPNEYAELDTPFWMLETRGRFSVKSAWDYLRRRDKPRLAYRMIW